MNFHDKLMDLERLAKTFASLRSLGRKTCLAHGCFDILHLGHVRYLEKARSLCDFLAVTVTADAYVGKGPHRPVFLAEQRAEVLAALCVVDTVAINPWPTAEKTLLLLKPALYAKGSEYEADSDAPSTAIGVEVAACRQAGGAPVFIDTIVFSSSSLARRFYAPLVS